MGKYASKYVGAGAAPSGWTKIGNIAVDATGTGSATSSFTSGILDSYDNTGYVIISDTTTAGLVGRSTGGGTGTASANTPTYWTTVAKTDNSFITLVSNIAKQTFASAADAKSWLDSNGYWTSWTSGISYLLDTYNGAAAAYSLRKLSSTYSGNAIRVRRSSDNAEQNIGFDGSGNLDEVALTSFVGANNGFVTTWFDQSGNGRNQTQATAITQPRIVNSGTIEKIGAKPSINFISGTWMRNTTQLNVKSIFTLSKVDTFSQLQSLISFSLFSSTGPWIRSISPNYYWFTGNNDDYTYNVNGGAMYFNDHLHTTTDSILNQHILSSFGNANAAFGFADTISYGRDYLGKISEGVIYTSDERNGYRTGIVSNLNTYYSVY